MVKLKNERDGLHFYCLPLKSLNWLK